MSWSKALIAGAAGGFVSAILNALMHAGIMSGTYMKYEGLFRQDSSPLWFTAVAIVIGIAGGVLFAKTRSSWAAGAKGGLNFGFFIGLVSFAAQFYTPLIYQGFPYYLSWCWGGIALISWLGFGAVAGALYKGSAA